ncbi:MAG: CHAP domain-containing protein [Atopobium minutum]|nr:CHAP domain-containing protein [Atopobium minutum]MBS4873963.1 CHAP domain-containing protein [Atopobium minutum]
MSRVNEMLAAAAAEIGYNRFADPNPGTKYGRRYAQLVGNSYYGTNGVPYCAMFISWLFDKLGIPEPFLPEAYCPYLKNRAKQAGMLVDKHSARPGDIVLFDWGGDGVCDHVGLIEKNCGSYLQTIEGNTSTGTSGSQSNGGRVARRTRSFSSVNCVVRPNYSSGEWLKNDTGWWYRNADGSYTTDGWQAIEGKWYFFDEHGYMWRGWLQRNGYWYYLGADGAMLTGWQAINNKWYYFNGNGDMATGWVRDGGKWYFLKPNGDMQLGWIHEGGKWYLTDGSGAIKTNTIAVSGGNAYAFRPDGSMATGDVMASADENGVLQIKP